jgi:Phage integrase, N-terminal SAM-like domain
MAHIEDRWFRAETGPDGKPRRVKCSLHGKGMRYRVRFIDADGRERSKSFPDRQKRAAEDFMTEVESRKLRGHGFDPAACRMTFASYAQSWLDHQTFDESTRDVTERRLRRQILPHLGELELAAIRPAHIREMDRRLQLAGRSEGLRLVAFGNVSTILNAAVDDDRIVKNPCNARAAKPPRVPPLAGCTVDHRASQAPTRLPAASIRHPCRPRRRVWPTAGGNPRVGDRRYGQLRAHHPRRSTTEDRSESAGVCRTQGPEDSRGSVAGLGGRRPSCVHARIQAPSDLPAMAASGWETVSADLVVYGRKGVVLDRHTLNRYVWWPAATKAGIPQERRNGMHALRHYYASVLLDAGSLSRH